ncbi:putative armadillo-like helical protein [Lupinus albus]|uniref:Putative armadillo-like helical protein n=1 Tax=Lupinus albus TaxID=3870 RepID=A0A6A4PM70_LUPAL|nr:putative armadillo-like helical protein [Lupinus albus]
MRLQQGVLVAYCTPMTSKELNEEPYEVKISCTVSLDDKINSLHEAIASLAAEFKSEDSQEEHVFENFHSSRTIRKLILDCPNFASTLWEKALKGKSELWAHGHSCKVISAFLESPDSKLQKLAKNELQPLVDSGILKNLKPKEVATQ